MKKKRYLDGKTILWSLPWTAVTLVSALNLRALNWGADGGGLLAHLRYGLVYNLSSNVFDFLALCLTCFLLALLETETLRREKRRFFLPGVLELLVKEYGLPGILGRVLIRRTAMKGQGKPLIELV